MKVRDLVHAVRPPREMDGWANFSIEERMQREPDEKRIRAQLAPYIAKNADRFFGSIVVLVYEGEITFEPMSDLTKNVPAAYRQNAQRIGFITIDGGTLIVLDGQHRLLALRMVQQGGDPRRVRVRCRRGRGLCGLHQFRGQCEDPAHLQHRQPLCQADQPRRQHHHQRG